MNLRHQLLFISIIIFSAVLRFVWLDRIPPALYTDEANQGYNAYSILLTGRDEHGAFLPVSLRSFGDWKPPLPTYLIIPFVQFLGLNERAVRLPSAILGLISLILIYFLVQELFREKNKKNGTIALLTAFFLGISPWHIFQSRIAMLVVVAFFFYELGVFLFLKGLKEKKFLYLATISFTLAVYAYYGMRILIPLTSIFLLFFYKKELKGCFKQLLVCGILSMIVVFPLFWAFLKEPNVIFGRAKTVSIFYDRGVKLRQWELITQDGRDYPSFLARFFHNNFYLYTFSVVKRFFSHLDGRFLFLFGDQSSPFQIPNMGILYLADFIFLVFGLIALYHRRYSSRNFLVVLLGSSFIPASFTFMTPSSNRTFTAVLPFMVFISFGLFFLMEELQKIRKFFLFLVVLIYTFSFAYFLKNYFLVLPKNYAQYWSYEWSEVGKYIASLKESYENIFFLSENSMAYIYQLFYRKYDPAKFQKEAVRPYISDEYGFEHLSSFGNNYFLGFTRFSEIQENLVPNSLYVLLEKNSPKNLSYLQTIFYPNGQPIINFFESK